MDFSGAVAVIHSPVRGDPSWSPQSGIQVRSQETSTSLPTRPGLLRLVQLYWGVPSVGESGPAPPSLRCQEQNRILGRPRTWAVEPLSVAFLFPRVRSIRITADFPKAQLVLSEKRDGFHKLRALPRVELGNDNPGRTAMLT